MQRAIMRWVLALLFAGAGCAHLAFPEVLQKITPSWVPFPYLVIVATGIFEIFASAALLTRSYRMWAGVLLAVYSLCVWPANFKHAIDGIDLPFLGSSWLYHAPRLAFQPMIIWWALFSAEVTDWPFGCADRDHRLPDDR